MCDKLKLNGRNEERIANPRYRDCDLAIDFLISFLRLILVVILVSDLIK